MADRKSAPSRIVPGVVIDGRYRIVEPLGQGGVGRVLVAEHVELGRRVALKVLLDHVGDDPTMRKRFQREAQTLAAMSHPHIVALNDYGIWEGTPYLVMELLAGRTLRDLLDVEGTLPVDRAITIAHQVLRALGSAHDAGVIHRDLKPGNVFLQALSDHEDHVKLLDFGFAKSVDGPQTFVSADGVIVGTPAYMAPEQAGGGAVDHRADLYAAGVLIFEMLTGRRPFEGDPLEMIRARLSSDAPTMRAVRSDLAVPDELEGTVARALERHPEVRFQSAAEFSAELAKVRPETRRAPSSRRPPRPPIEAPAAHTMELRSGDLEVSAPRTMELRSGDLQALPAPPPPPRRSRAGGVIALVAIAGIAIAAIAAWQVAGIGSPTARSAPPPDAPVPEVASPAIEVHDPGSPTPIEGAPEEPIAVAEPTAAVPAGPSDPWAREAPPELLALRASFERSTPPTPQDLQRAGIYARHHVDDPRALLVLAHGFVRARWMSEALARYAEAHARDPEVRGDRQMLENLVDIATSPMAGARARELLTSIYGREALDTLDARIAAGELEPGDVETLRALRSSIAARP